jgi:hypothetical protein
MLFCTNVNVVAFPERTTFRVFFISKCPTQPGESDISNWKEEYNRIRSKLMYSYAHPSTFLADNDDFIVLRHDNTVYNNTENLLPFMMLN